MRESDPFGQFGRLVSRRGTAPRMVTRVRGRRGYPGGPGRRPQPRYAHRSLPSESNGTTWIQARGIAMMLREALELATGNAPVSAPIPTATPSLRRPAQWTRGVTLPGARACKARRSPSTQARGGPAGNRIRTISMPRRPATFRTSPWWSCRESHSGFVDAGDEGGLPHNPIEPHVEALVFTSSVCDCDTSFANTAGSSKPGRGWRRPSRTSDTAWCTSFRKGGHRHVFFITVSPSQAVKESNLLSGFWRPLGHHDSTTYFCNLGAPYRSRAGLNPWTVDLRHSSHHGASSSPRLESDQDISLRSAELAIQLDEEIWVSSEDRTRTFRATTERADHYAMPTIIVRMRGVAPPVACTQNKRCTPQLHPVSVGEA